MSLEYHRAVTRHLGCMHVLVYARACDSECRRHGSDEINYVHIMYVSFCDCKKSVYLKVLKSVFAWV